MYLCYSLSTKEKNAQAAAAHMEKWGLQQRRAELIDIKSKNYLDIKKYIQHMKSAAVILTPGLITDIYGLVELDIIHNLFLNSLIEVTTFAYNVDMSDLPMRLQWLTDTRMIFVNQLNDIYCGIGGLLRVEIEETQKKYGGTEKCKKQGINFLVSDLFLQKALDIYRQIESFNFKARIVLIYCIYHYIAVQYKLFYAQSVYEVWLKQIFYNMDLLESEQNYGFIYIAEQCLLLSVCEMVEKMKNEK